MNTLNKLRLLAAAGKEINKGEIQFFADTPSGKYPRTYNQREACDATGLHSRKIIGACEQLGIDYKDGNKFCIDAMDIKKLNKALDRARPRKADSECAIWCVTQQKGGSGKSTLATAIATGLASECLNNWRVGFFDLDPQATGTRILKPNFNDTMISVGDLLTNNIKLGSNETFESVCKSSCYPSSLPDLHVLCARPEDRFYETYVERKRIAADKTNSEFTSHKDLNRILDAVKDDFDIIIIDTTPYFSAATYAAHFAANNIIVPMKPSKNDTDSSTKYFSQLADVYEILAGMGHTGYKHIVIQPTMVKPSDAHIDMIAEIRQTYGADCSQYDFVDSDAVLHCAKENSTIYDISASEYELGSKKSLRRAQTLTRQIVKDIESKTIDFWNN